MPETFVFAGKSIAGLVPHNIARMGVARTFQSLRLFLNMSVMENVMAATYGHTKAMPWESVLRLPRARREEREARALAADVLSFFGQRLAGYRWDQPAYSLSYANRRRLEIARALATRPWLLLLDEPAAGMNPAETHEITELIARLRDERDVAILVIEHDMHVVGILLRPGGRARPRCQDRRGRLRRGREPSGGGRGLPRARPRSTVGRGMSAPPPEAAAAGCSASTTSPPTTARCGSSKGSRWRCATGELVCLLGGNASGKSTTLKTILGIVRPRAGRVLLARRGRDGPGRCRSGSPVASRSCRRTAGCSGR